MHSEEIPFNKHLGLKVSEKKGYLLELPESPIYKNHIGTVHASAQYGLAEAASGEFLLRHFSSFAKSTIPVVRKVELKYRKIGMGRLFAKVSGLDEDMELLKKNLEKKRPGRITLTVSIENQVQEEIAKGKVDWFIQSLQE